MTNDPIEATGELLAALGTGLGGIQKVGLGNVNGRRYLFHVGVGFDAAVVAEVEKRSTLKRYLGSAFFAFAAFDTWARHYDRHHPHFSVQIHRRNGEEVTVGDGYFAIVLNSDPYTFLGDRQFNLVPGTDLASPLSAVVISSMGATTMLRLTAAALRGRSGIGNYRKVTVVDDVTEAVLTPRPDVPYQVDGDYLGNAGRLEFRWEPDSLRLVMPRR
jgi:diacylglycerol kinase family enzyme